MDRFRADCPTIERGGNAFALLVSWSSVGQNSINRLCECTERGVVGQPHGCVDRYSSRNTSSGFCPNTRWLASQPQATVSRPAPIQATTVSPGWK